MDFQPFDFELNRLMLFQKRVVSTKCHVYVFIVQISYDIHLSDRVYNMTTKPGLGYTFPEECHIIYPVWLLNNIYILQIWPLFLFNKEPNFRICFLFGDFFLSCLFVFFFLFFRFHFVCLLLFSILCFFYPTYILQIHM